VRRLCIAFGSMAAVAVVAVPAALGSTAKIAIRGGGLTLANPSVMVVGHNPVQLDVRSTVTDPRGTGGGWLLSVAAYARGSGPSSPVLVVAGATAACVSGSVCTLPVNAVRYPVPVSLTGSRAIVFEARPSTGLGAQVVDFRVIVSSAAPSG
jgi:hypothetical protein